MCKTGGAGGKAPAFLLVLFFAHSPCTCAYTLHYPFGVGFPKGSVVCMEVRFNFFFGSFFFVAGVEAWGMVAGCRGVKCTSR